MVIPSVMIAAKMRTGATLLGVVLWAAVVVLMTTGDVDNSRIYMFWNEDYDITAEQAHRLACSDWRNFTFLLHEKVYNRTMAAAALCASSAGAAAVEVDASGNPKPAAAVWRSLRPSVDGTAFRSPRRNAANFQRITPLLFEDPIWKNFTEADIFIAVLYQAFRPHEHIDAMMNHVVQASIFVICWSADRFFNFDLSTNAHERKFIPLMLNVIPSHERPKLLELPVPMDALINGLPAGPIATAMLEKNLVKWETRRQQLAQGPEGLEVKPSCTGPRPTGTEFACTARMARAYHPVTQDEIDAEPEDKLPHYNSFSIRRVFDADTSMLVRTIASSAHLQWVAGDLPDPVHGPVHEDPECVASNMTDIDRKLALATAVADPDRWQSATVLAARDAAAVAAAGGGGGEPPGGERWGYPNEYDTSGHVVNPHSRSDPRYRERLLCLTYTVQGWQGAPGREDSGRGRAVEYIRSTWGKRCDGYLAISNLTDHTLSTIHVEPMRANWTENYHEMWLKAQLMWKLVGSTMLDNYDYYVIGGDDLYVVVENLREYLARPEIRALGGPDGREPVYLGRVLNQNLYIRFNTGGAGYVMNAAAVAALYRHMDHPECMPAISTSMEDVMVGQCFRYAGVFPVLDTSDHGDPDTAKAAAVQAAAAAASSSPVDPDDAEDPLAVLDQVSDVGKGRNLGRERFHPQSPNVSYWAADEWYQAKAYSYGVHDNCCAAKSITYQDIKGGAFMTCFHAAIYQY
jgi:hypothetical protein